ncbi:hypothetical protein EON63_04655 [archaeon]|nr:MAG: hypothetical protein EON63_04655 [archaeon]
MKSPNLPNSYLTYPSLRPSILTPASTALDNRVSLVPLEVVPKFSRARSTQLAKVGLLGVANLVGVAALGESLVVAKGKVRKAGELVGFLKMVYPPLTIYALGFVCLPLVRYIYHVGWEKGRIQGRNEKRTQWVQQLQGTPTSSLREKLVDKVRWLTSKKQASSVVEGHGEVVFSTLNSQALKDDKMEEKKLETLR